MTEEVLFKLPTSPQEFGVALEPAQLRRLDFSALDFETLRRAGIEYIKTYFPEEFNDFVAHNGVIMILELVSFIANNITQRLDILSDESFLPTSQTEEAVSQHLALIDQKIRPASPAIADILVSVGAPIVTEVKVPAGIKFNLRGEDGRSLIYELFRAPGDFTSSISILPGKRGVVAFGIEGRFEAPVTVVSAGGPDQFVDIIKGDILDEPITVTISTGNGNIVKSRRVPIMERAEATDEVFEVVRLERGIRVKFGDDVSGKAPLAGQIISVKFRAGGGIRGRIGANIINESRPVTPEPPATAAVEVLFRNINPSTGGTDAETLEQAKKRAPREFAAQERSVSGEDYSILASTFSHPVFGSVAKAVSVVRTGIDADIDLIIDQIRSATDDEAAKEILLTNFVNRNIVELYVLADGPTGPVKPSAGLKQGLETFFFEIDVLTDETRILDGDIKPLDIKATIIMSRNVDAGTVKEQVTTVINQFFDIGNFDMGQAFNLSNLYEEIQTVPGVKFVNIFEPADNVLPTGKLGNPDSPGVGFNQLIVLGSVDLRFFFESGRFTS